MTRFTPGQVLRIKSGWHRYNLYLVKREFSLDVVGEWYKTATPSDDRLCLRQWLVRYGFLVELPEPIHVELFV